MTAAPTAIPDGWRVVRLGDVAEVSFSSVDKRTTAGEAPVELCNYTDVYYNRRIRRDMPFMVATASPAERAKWSLRQGDVLFTKDSETPDDIGVPAYVAEDLPDVLCGYHLGLARPTPASVDGAFLARSLASPAAAREFARVANGVTRFGLTLGATRSLPVLLPPLREQRAIAAVLDSIDETIELADEVIIATERLREALLHELLTRGLPGRHSKCVDVPGLGAVPACWDVVRLGEVAEVVGGTTPSRSRPEFWSGDVAWVVPSELTELPGRYLDAARESITREGVRAAGLRLIPPGSVLLTTRATIGVAAINRVTVTTNQGFQNLVPRGGTDGLWLYYLIAAMKRELERRGAGSTFLEVSRDSVRSLRVPRPPLDEQRAIAATLDRVDGTIERGRAERDALKSMNASAADALLSGRIRVSNTAEPDTPKATNVLESHMNRSEVLRTLRAHHATLAEQFGVTGLTLFGSVARDQATDESDIDILAEFDSAPGWREYFGAQAYLEAVLGRPVDLMTAGEVRPEIRPYVERDAINV